MAFATLMTEKNKRLSKKADRNSSVKSHASKNGLSNGDSSQNFAQRSSLYQEFLAEREEILRHKWLESEKQGKDIGFERALLDWIRKHRESWRQTRKSTRND